MIFARQGGGRRKADALQGRQRSIAKIRPQRLSTFSQELVLERKEALAPIHIKIVSVSISVSCMPKGRFPMFMRTSLLKQVKSQSEIS